MVVGPSADRGAVRRSSRALSVYPARPALGSPSLSVHAVKASLEGKDADLSRELGYGGGYGGGSTAIVPDGLGSPIHLREPVLAQIGLGGCLFTTPRT